MPKKKIRPASKTAHTRSIVDFLNTAFKDYLAAGVLLVSRLPYQAAVLASTAIEKYCKAILALHGNQSHGHLSDAHLESMRNWDKSLYDSFNEEFLQLIQKCYQLRYIDALPDGVLTRNNMVVPEQPWIAYREQVVVS